MIFILFLLGATFGSFLNVVIDRLPQGQSLVHPPSHCPNCGRRLSRIELIPLFSYLCLSGRCRTCKSHIPMRVFWIELATAIIFTFLYWRYGLGAELALLCVYTCIFIAIFVIDLDHQLILNKVVYPAGLFALATVPLNPEVDIVESLAGGGVGLALLFIPAMLGGMGFGDVKMLGMIGLAVGWPVVFVATFVGIIIGGIVGIGLLVSKRQGRKAAIPFGPFLAVGGMVALIWGNTIWDWYTPG